MNILAVDLSLTGTGICHPDGTTETLDPKTRTGMERIAWIRDMVWDRVVVTLVDLVVIEGYSFSSKSAHAHELGELGGVVRLHLIEKGVRYVDVPPKSLKKYATGKGNANKTMVCTAAAARTGRQFPDDNQADAYWLWAMAKDQYGELVLSVPKLNREALAAVPWPQSEVPSPYA